MSELFAAFRQHLVWALMLWVLIFTAFTALFANGRLIAFASGLWRVLTSIVATPFRFLRRAVAAVLGDTPEAEVRRRASDQYLLNKGMLVLQAIVIVTAVGALSAAVVVTWNVLVPPAEVRRAAQQYERDFNAQQRKSDAAKVEVEKLDAEWAPKEQAAIAAYRKARQTTIVSGQKSMTDIATRVQSYGGPDVLSTLRRQENAVSQWDDREAAPVRTIDSRDEADERKRELDSIVANSWYWIGDWRSTLDRWSELWQQTAIAEYELRTVSVEDLRAGQQPAYAQARAIREAEQETLKQMEPGLANLREAARLKWKAAGVRALQAFVTFLIFVWLAGALIEGGWMAIRVADDVRRMREAATPEPASAVAAAEVRLPIRESSAAPRAEPRNPN